MLVYKLKEAIAGAEDVSSGLRVVRIEAGELLLVEGREPQNGCVRATLHDRTVTVYGQDLREKAEKSLA